jgi:hypothetical protein
MDPRLIADAKDALFLTNCFLEMRMPSVLEPGEPFDLRITAIGTDCLPMQNITRKLLFEESPGVIGLPESVTLSPDDGGVVVIPDLEAVGPGHACVSARLDGAEAPVFSNPAWVMNDPPYRIFWGDIHVHTTYSNCSDWACKDPEFCYAYARDVSCLDFCAAADHLRGIASEEGRWARLQELVRLYDEPGRFVPFLAFESSHKTGWGGDHNAYYAGLDGPYFWLDRDDMRGISPEVTLRQLWDFLDATGEEYFTVPHHTGRAGKYRSFADPVYDAQREPVFEIFSCWGTSESRHSRFPLLGGNTDTPSYFVDAIKAGCRYGVIASSDDHRTLPGGEHVSAVRTGPRPLNSHPGNGLTAVRAPELTRASIVKAIKSRNCYATTFARTLLDMTVDDIPMGQEAHVPAADSLRRRRTIRVKLMSTEQERTDVVLMRNGEEIARREWNREAPEIVFEDADKLEDIAIRDAQFHPAPFVAYYVRAETRSRLEDRAGQTQWSSPIWLDL